jgi:uncharacterized iron-regulated protein
MPRAGVVLIAGNDHVRRDIGVPRWLDASLQGRVEVVGQVESAANGLARNLLNA